MDYVSDVLSDGRKERVFNVMDDCNREELAMDVGINYLTKRSQVYLEDLGNVVQNKKNGTKVHTKLQTYA